jgi:threonine/homoserine/homoserine lactone efflux protein
METLYLMKGIIIGFSLALPVGPIGILCIRRTLAHGGRYGVLTGLAAASADMMYGIVAAFGISLVSDFITTEQFWIRSVGGVLLIILGVRLWRSHPSEQPPANGITGHTRIYVSTFLLTLTNPMTMFAFAAVFAGIGIGQINHDHFSASMLVLGVFLGSLTWFLFLTGLVRIFKERVSTGGVRTINKASGALLIVFGFVALGSVALFLLQH